MKQVKIQVCPGLSKQLVVGNKVFRSSCDFQVTDRDLEKARKELKETADKREMCLKDLKRMLSKDKRMKYRMDNEYLLRFLRFRKFKTQKTYEIIQRFYTMRNENPLLFILPSDAELKLRGKFNNVMPYTNDNGEMVFLHQIEHWNPSEVSVRDFCVIFSYVSDVVSMNPHAQIDGVIVIFDLKNISTRQVTELLYPPALKLWTKFMQELYPFRVKRIIAFNINAVLYASSYVVLSFLKRKIADRIVLIRSDLEELHKHVNPEILPKEYGGNLDNEECFSYLKKIVFSNKEYIKYENSFVGYNK